MRIKELRTKRNMTQQDLADKLGVFQTTVGQWENGKREPNIETIKRLASIFEVSTDYLLGQSDNPIPAPDNSTKEDKFNYHISKLNDEQKAKIMEYAEFLKSREEFSEDVSTVLDTLGQKPSME
jgi:transcriptional regulator with XRE-family HTH domain